MTFKAWKIASVATLFNSRGQSTKHEANDWRNREIGREREGEREREREREREKDLQE